MDEISTGIKKVLFIFLLLFVVVISYVAYFELYTAPKIVNNTDNARIWATRNEVLRGTIYDKNKVALAVSTRAKDSTTQNRQYTGGADFAHVIGYASTQYGLTGLESVYDKYLTASNNVGIIEYIKQLIENKGFVSQNDKKGNNIITTIDSNVQKQHLIYWEIIGAQL